MKTDRLVVLPAAVVTIAGLTSCRTSGMAMTSRGPLFKVNIYAPESLPDGGEGNVDVVRSVHPTMAG